MARSSLQLLERLLEGHRIIADELDDLVSNHVREDLYLEYKHGDMLKNVDASDVVREYMSGFANSAGGIFIVGIDAPDGDPQKITGCQRRNKNLADWASDCLIPIASYFSPPPRFHVITHPQQGNVLIGVVPRSFGLVPLADSGGFVYHFRFHDKTLKAPDYLMADLLLGRRQNPILEIGDCCMKNLRRFPDNKADTLSLGFELQLNLENRGFVWAEECRWGVIAWAQGMSNPSGYEVGSPGNYLLSFVDISDQQTNDWPLEKNLYHIHQENHSIRKPFGVESKKINVMLPSRVHNVWFTYAWKAAAYLISKNSLPVWFQICINMDTNLTSKVDENPRITSSSGIISVTRLVNERPIVAWEGFITQ